MNVHGYDVPASVEASAVEWIRRRGLARLRGEGDGTFQYREFVDTVAEILPSGVGPVAAERILCRLRKAGKVRNVSKGVMYGTEAGGIGPFNRPCADRPAGTAPRLVRLREREWQEISELFPSDHPSVRRPAMRRVLDACLYLMQNGWDNTPLPAKRFPPRSKVAVLVEEMQYLGIWPSIHTALGQLIELRGHAAATRGSVSGFVPGGRGGPAAGLRPCESQPIVERVPAAPATLAACAAEPAPFRSARPSAAGPALAPYPPGVGRLAARNSSMDLNGASMNALRSGAG